LEEQKGTGIGITVKREQREESTMSSNNYGVRITDAAAAAAQVAAWDFTRNHFTVSVRAGKVGYVPDLPDIEQSGCTITGWHLKERIDHFDDEIAVYDFGNGYIGLCLLDARENHYFVPNEREKSNTPAPTNESTEDAEFAGF
jgi:hypothetical protein